MIRFSLLRVEMSKYSLEISLGEFGTSVNKVRPLFGLGWSYLDGFRFGAFFLKKWGLPLAQGLRLLDFRVYNENWEGKMFGKRFDLYIFC